MLFSDIIHTHVRLKHQEHCGDDDGDYSELSHKVHLEAAKTNVFAT